MMTKISEEINYKEAYEKEHLKNARLASRIAVTSQEFVCQESHRWLTVPPFTPEMLIMGPHSFLSKEKE